MKEKNSRKKIKLAWVEEEATEGKWRKRGKGGDWRIQERKGGDL